MGSSGWRFNYAGVLASGYYGVERNLMRINIDQLITTQDFTDSGTEEAIIGLYAYLLNNGIPKEDSIPWISRLMTVLKNEYKDVSEPKGTKAIDLKEAYENVYRCAMEKGDFNRALDALDRIREISEPTGKSGSIPEEDETWYKIEWYGGQWYIDGVACERPDWIGQYPSVPKIGMWIKR